MSPLFKLRDSDVVERYELAYLVHTRMVVSGRPVYHDTVVSARDANILAQWNMLQTVGRL